MVPGASWAGRTGLRLCGYDCVCYNCLVVRGKSPARTGAKQCLIMSTMACAMRRYSCGSSYLRRLFAFKYQPQWKAIPASDTKACRGDALPLIHIHEASPLSSPSISFSQLSLLPTPYRLHHTLVNPIFDFDVSIHPLGNPSICNLELQKESVTEPPTRSITLESNHLPWPITVSTEHYYLTVFDLLVGIYNNLRTPAKEEEFARESREKQDKIASAYYDRWERRTPSEFREQERCKGLRRVDFLPQNTLRFSGLEKAKGSDTWVMQLRQ
ncbi:hypothetical protein Agabi119p4_7754 [Agaricus bisporus var. burnettii]|uniref:DUF6699 domain-containing protein n=1 Tax=Agaricus bisporus var. burnettii TaxID=192524 RepID=A0A8H7C8Q2_AGABI|nr:hypothetical protein Agabi119p4_7754 [Agaricus bisporus var. burnettii]